MKQKIKNLKCKSVHIFEGYQSTFSRSKVFFKYIVFVALCSTVLYTIVIALIIYSPLRSSKGRNPEPLVFTPLGHQVYHR